MTRTSLGDAHDDAVDRLDKALVEQTRSGERYRSSLGTVNEFGAYVRLQGAGEEVAARQSWLDSVKDGRVDCEGWVNGRRVGGPRSIFEGR